VPPSWLFLLEFYEAVEMKVSAFIHSLLAILLAA